MALLYRNSPLIFKHTCSFSRQSVLFPRLIYRCFITLFSTSIFDCNFETFSNCKFISCVLKSEYMLLILIDWLIDWLIENSYQEISSQRNQLGVSWFGYLSSSKTLAKIHNNLSTILHLQNSIFSFFFNKQKIETSSLGRKMEVIVETYLRWTDKCKYTNWPETAQTGHQSKWKAVRGSIRCCNEVSLKESTIYIHSVICISRV